MTTVNRDAHYKYSQADLNVVAEGMRKMSTYIPDKTGGSVSSSEVPKVLELMQKERGPVQVKLYTEFWDKNYNGRMPLKEVIEMVSGLDKTESYAECLISGCDRNKNGFIERDEFKFVLEVMVAHDASMAGFEKTYDDFLVEADVNKDGKVSVAEGAAWVENKLKTWNK